MPSAILEKLRRERSRKLGLLNILERQLCGIRGGDTPDYELMLQILLHLGGRPGGQYSPLEEALLNHVAALCPDLNLSATRLARRHRHLQRRGETLSETVAQVLDGHLVSRARLVRAGRRYTDACGEHLRDEEDNLFTPLAENLTTADWHALEAALAPLAAALGEDVPEYEALADRLTAEGAGTWPWRVAEDQSCPVCSQA
ncbi:hypothetical protein [Spectribacter hydrogenoxidans]|uniref:Hemerythrin-like domain-containing protein n=1 Tax=Spectribacter hydrogenoxidans TaxID=3075608 RepID=A0ABU3BYD8_9GAMM|nr:hypothetical protein [Salinisphaera sp. W335]MDT0634331.1 hypothetical protein [Salinisphaera sp. W335]